MNCNFDGLFSLLNLVFGAVGGIAVVLIVFAKYQQKVDDLKEDMKDSVKKIEVLRSDVDTLKEFRVNAQKFIDKNLYSAKSPLQLSEIGKKMVEESGFSQIFSQCKDDLALLLEKKDPKTQYDVQEKARSLMDELGEYPAFQPIKTYAFKSGNDFLQILRAGSILLRDYYFVRHPEIQK